MYAVCIPDQDNTTFILKKISQRGSPNHSTESKMLLYLIWGKEQHLDIFLEQVVPCWSSSVTKSIYLRVFSPGPPTPSLKSFLGEYRSIMLLETMG